MARFEVGSLVRCREREWVVLPSERDDVLLLRPLGGVEAEVCGIYLPVEGDGVAPATFTPPEPGQAGDFVSGQLLRDAARLALRSGAGPFRSLGRLGVRPRPYQLVPLIMALRLDPVRLLIADDVGIGKTIEAGLIARELFDRGEIRGLTILCPPHLCDQWQRELAEKFALDAVVVRSSTAAALERGLPRGDVSIFEHYPFTIVSIDYVKGDRRRDNFLRTCPELVVVDEAHTATQAGGRAAAQQRFELVRDLAAKPDRHLLLLTATPHSGIEDAFQSLLGLLAPRFGLLDPERLAERERDELARHFVQRRRADVQRWLGEDTPFPSRLSAEVTYTMPRAGEYRKLFDDVLGFTRELVRDSDAPGAGRGSWRQRARYWAALALLRCVMSSPAAAEKALRVRAGGVDAIVEIDGDVGDEVFSGYIYDTTDQEGVHDLEPSQVVAQGSPPSERGRLQRFAARAAALGGANDPKLLKLVPLLDELLRAGFNPIVYCRYIATATYLAHELSGRLKGYAADPSASSGQALRVLAVTGERSEEERESLVAELEQSPRRLLVATDCLSEGINLQQSFDAVIHYDLPWNPNRLEQREGRVDRYGQPSPQVRTALFYSEDNPMDAAVMHVLLRKAVLIHRSLGISVPLPMQSDSVVQALISALFQPAVEQASLFDTADQLTLLDANESLRQVEQAWDAAEAREKESRTRFAQRRIKPEEVAREVEESDAVLGDAATVEHFVRGACERLGAPLQSPAGAKGGRSAADTTFALPLAQLPDAVRERLAGLAAHFPKGRMPDLLPLTFQNPAPNGVQSIGRNHVLTAALADYLVESAFAPHVAEPPASRCGVVRTADVSRRTTVLLLRVRMLIEGKRQRTPTLAEELVVCAYAGRAETAAWLDEALALELLGRAQPSANLSADERAINLQRALEQIPALQSQLDAIAGARAEQLRASHQRVRSATGAGSATVRPHLPPDLLGVYVLLPVV